MNQKFFLIIFVCHLSLTQQLKQENIIINKLATAKDSLRQITLTDEKIPFYQENEMSIFIVNKLNSKFNFNSIANNHDGIQSIENNFDLAKSNTADSMYTLLYSDDKHFLVGSRNRLFNFSMNNLLDKSSLNRKINWSENTSKTQCKTQFYYNQNECVNYIRGSIPLLDNSLVIACGTNFNQPYCRKYTLNKSTNLLEYGRSLSVKMENKYIRENVNFKPQPLQITETFSHTQNIPPFSYGNNIFYFHSSLQSQDIFKQNFVVDSKENIILNDLITTPQGAILNPNFRTSYGYKDKVYFFFSESELSHFKNGVSFKTPQSLVGEICANDDGRSSFSGGRRFLTFKKTIINCYVPESEMFHVKYTEIQEATKPVKMGQSNDDVFYAIFSIRRSANVFDSALCMYKISQIEETLKGRFKNNPQKSSLVNPLDSCDSYKNMNTLQIDNYYKDIIKNEKFQMEQTVNQKALFALNNVKFTSIAVDVVKNRNNHILFLGLNDGRVLKIMNQIQSKSGQNFNQPIILGEYQMFANNLPINSIILFESKKLIAITNNEIKSISLEIQCKKYKTCRQCVYAQDPNCAWSTLKSKCVFAIGENEFLTQDIQNGDGMKMCTASNTDTDIFYSINTSVFDDSENLQKVEQLNASSSSSSIIFIIILFTAILTSIFSVCLTWVYIKKRYETHPKDELIGSMKGTDYVRRMWQSLKNNPYLISVLNHLSQNQNSTDNLGKSEHFHDHNLLKQPKILNCYETPHVMCNTNKSNLKPVTVNTSTSTSSSTRPNSSSEDSSPTTTSSLTASSNNNSPNNLGSKCSRASCECDDDNDIDEEDNGLLTPVSSKYSNIIISHQRLSSSDDSFQPVIIRSSQSSSSGNRNLNTNNNSNNSNKYFMISKDNSDSKNPRSRELDL